MNREACGHSSRGSSRRSLRLWAGEDKSSRFATRISTAADREFLPPSGDGQEALPRLRRSLAPEDGAWTPPVRLPDDLRNPQDLGIWVLGDTETNGPGDEEELVWRDRLGGSSLHQDLHYRQNGPENNTLGPKPPPIAESRIHPRFVRA